MTSLYYIIIYRTILTTKFKVQTQIYILYIIAHSISIQQSIKFTTIYKM